MSQDFKHTYKDAILEVTVEAQSDKTQANPHELMEAVLKIVRCTDNWEKFELYVVKYE